MAASTSDRNTDRRASRQPAYPVAAATKIYAGILCALNAAGYVVPAADTAGLRVIGVSQQQVDNTAGANGDLFVQLWRRDDEYNEFLFDNDGTNPLTQADLFKQAYVKDDHTVCVVAGSANKVKAGRFVGFGKNGTDATKVWIEVNHASGLGAPAVTTADGSDAATTQALANALKAAFNGAL